MAEDHICAASTAVGQASVKAAGSRSVTPGQPTGGDTGEAYTGPTEQHGERADVVGVPTQIGVEVDEFLEA